MDNKELLQQLRDIHYPEPVSWWPLAPGWFIVFILIAIVGSIVSIKGYQMWRKKQKLKNITHQFEKLEHILQRNPKSPKVVSYLSIFLKQITLLLYPRSQVAALSGEAWLQFLDKEGNTDAFTQGVGRLLITAPYQAKPPAQMKELMSLVEDWVKQQIKKKL